MGSSNKYSYNEATGEMILEPELNSYNDGREKAANIALIIGKAPVILAATGKLFGSHPAAGRAMENQLGGNWRS